MKTVGLVGNPNCGKTTLFNQLTGSTAHVGNWPGVTVERKEGVAQSPAGERYTIIDLPGIYSLSSYTQEERIAAHYLLQNTPDFLINVVDAAHLERNLYVTTQLMELNCPIILVLNMMDETEKQGIQIDIEGLSRFLNMPIVPISAVKGSGLERLRKQMDLVAAKEVVLSPLFSMSIGPVLSEIHCVLQTYEERHPLHYAVKLLENEQELYRHPDWRQEENKLRRLRGQAVKAAAFADMEAVIANDRYRFITDYVMNFVQQQKESKKTVSDRADELLANKWFGFPIFLGVMGLVFHITFGSHFLGSQYPSPGLYLRQCMEWVLAQAGEILRKMILLLSVPEEVQAFLIFGIGTGVGTVLSFLPQILCLFFFLSILEDSGYMARGAFVLDSLFGKLGLSGRSFLPLISGFGCSVPAMMGCRTLYTNKEKERALFLIPFFSCSAKLTIYSLFVSAFFPNNGDAVIFGIYLFGVGMAVLVALCLEQFTSNKTAASFLLELPPYRVPENRNTITFLKDKGKEYCLRAGTILTAASGMVWLLSQYSFSLERVSIENSILCVFGKWLTPAFQPLGFASGGEGWKPVVSILSGFMAKEAVVSTLGVLYQGGAATSAVFSPEAQLGLADYFSVPSALSFMVFNLLCMPCISAVSTHWIEMRSWKKTAKSVILWMGIAWIASYGVYCLGKRIV